MCLQYSFFCSDIWVARLKLRREREGGKRERGGEGREGRGRGERYCVCVSGGKEYLVINHNSFFFSISICSFVLCWCGEGENEEMSGGGRREEGGGKCR
jgi:hypothetical protein